MEDVAPIPPPPPEFNIKIHWKFLLLLFVASVIACLWIYIHFSSVWWVTPLAFVLGGVQFVFGLLAWLFTDAENSKIKEFIRAMLMPFMAWRPVIITYSVLVILICFVSSITVTAFDSSDLLIRLSGSKDGLATSDSEVVERGMTRSFIRFIVPWGKTYHSEGACIRYQSFVVYPWLTRKINLESDPSLMFRFADAPSTFKGGRLVIYHDHDSTEILNNLSNALFLGCNVPQKTSEWRTDLVQEEFPESVISKFVTGWQRVRPYNLEWKLVVGDTIRVKFFTMTGRLKFDSKNVQIQESLDMLLFELNETKTP